MWSVLRGCVIFGVDVALETRVGVCPKQPSSLARGPADGVSSDACCATWTCGVLVCNANAGDGVSSKQPSRRCDVTGAYSTKMFVSTIKITTPGLR